MVEFYARRAVHAREPADPLEPVCGPLNEREAAVHFPTNAAEIYRYDPLAFSVPRATDEPLQLEFDEHPEGGFDVVSNALGLREDHEVEQPKRDLRVLVLGDSHTYGLVANDESFANLLEPLLAENLSGRHVDVLNAGVGSTFFQNYLGNLRRLADLEPDAVVLVAYGGNDFSATMGLDRYLRGQGIPAVAPHYHRANRLPPARPSKRRTSSTTSATTRATSSAPRPPLPA